MPHATVEALELTHQERRQAREAADALSEGTLKVSQLPEAARHLLSHILVELAEGHTLSVIQSETNLTTSEAARFLNVSRPYFSRLLDEGKLPFHAVGTHKRVRLQDLTAYRERQDEDSYAALAELQAQAQELKMGY